MTVKWSAFAAGSAIGGTDIPVGLQGGANVQWTWNQIATFMWNSPTLVTPTLGVATATTINKVAITAPASAATLTIANNKTLTANASITLAGTDGQTFTFPNAASGNADTVAVLGTAQTYTGAPTFNANVTLGSSQQLLWSTDLILTRAAAAKLQLGAVDAAAPVAQTLQVQSVVAGTSNTAGTNWTLIASLSTGTGTSGSNILQTGFAGVTQSAASVTCTSASPGVVTLTTHGFVPGQSFQFGGSAAPTGTSLATTYYVSATGLAVNTFQFSATPGGASINTSSTGTALTLTTGASTQNPASAIATWGPSGLTGSQTTPLLSLAQTWNTSGNVDAPIFLNVTNIASGATSQLIDLQLGGLTLFSVRKDGFVNVNQNAINIGPTNLTLGNNTAKFLMGGSADLILSWGAAATFQLGTADVNGNAVAQTIRCQSGITGTDRNGGNFTLLAGKGTGAGTPGTLVLQVANQLGTGTTAQTAATGLTIQYGLLNMQPSVVCGNQALATTATDGFIYIAGGSGPPTGVPTAFTGRYPLYWDHTNKQLYVYDAAWLQPKTPAAAAIVNWQ